MKNEIKHQLKTINYKTDMGKKIIKTGSLEKRKKLSRGSKNSILIRDLREKINRKKNKHKSK
jgi:hypothetical protein